MLLGAVWFWPLVFILTGCIVTVLSMPHLARLALRCGMVDQPSFRKTHRCPIPLCGGIAVFVPTFLTLVVFAGLACTDCSRLGPNCFQMITLLIALVWVFLLGLIDDLQQLSWKQKLCGQFIGILILMLGGHSVRSATVPYFGPVDFAWTGPLVFGFSVLLLMNAVNLIDGLDGLAGGICFFGSLVYGVVGTVNGDMFASTTGFVLSGSLLGFLAFNLPPARVFLGDAGSLMLGFLLGTLATSYAANQFVGQRSATFSVMLAPFLPFGIALMDVFIAILRRWIRGGRIFLSDSDHLHHRLLAEFESPRTVVGIIYAFSLIFAVLSVIVTLTPEHSFTHIHISLIVFSGIVLSALVLRCYRLNHLSQALLDRPHFRFLDSYRDFVLVKFRRCGTETELTQVLQSGVRDLDFDSVVVLRDDGMLASWVSPGRIHVEAPRIILKRDFKELNLSIQAIVPKHDSEAYQNYLFSVWMDVLDGFASSYWGIVHPLGQHELLIIRSGCKTTIWL